MALNSEELAELQAIQSATFEQFREAYNSNPTTGVAATYYSYLADKGVNYGDLAFSVSTDQGPRGVIANAHLGNYAAEHYNMDLSVGSEKWLRVQYDLMRADYSARDIAEGNDLPWTRYQEYHAQVFVGNGLDANAWTANIPLHLMEKISTEKAAALWDHLLDNQGYFDVLMQGHFMIFQIPISLDQSPKEITDDYEDHTVWVGDMLMLSGEKVWDAFKSLLPLEDYPVFWQRAASINQDARFVLESMADNYNWGFDPLSNALNGIKLIFNAVKFFTSPIVLDIDGEGGIELTDINTTTVYFDVNNDGYAEKTAWVTGGDGILTIDLNADNLVQAEEIFGNATGFDNGFLTLHQYDTNNDGAITSEDVKYDQMRVWIDANLNGYAENGELYTLANLQITQINVGYLNVNYQISGNNIYQESTFIIGGDTRTLVDAYFEADPTNSTYSQEYIFDTSTLFLPTTRGYGLLADMHIAASVDNMGAGNLKELLETFGALTLANAFTSSTAITDSVRAILYRWAGVDDVSSNSRGNFVDGQELAFLEQLMGQDWLQRNSYSNPRGPEAGGGINEAFEMALNHFTAILMAQTEAGQLFTGDYYYNISTDAMVGITGLNLSVLDALETEASALGGSAARTLFWQNVVRMVEFTIGTANLDSTSLAQLQSAIVDSDATLTLTGIVNSLPYQHPTGVSETGTASADAFTGSSGDDHYAGNAGNDIINGAAGNDNLLGYNDADTITGGTGDDLIDGGVGDDVFIYNPGDGYDTVVDAGGTDKIIFGAGINSSGHVTMTRIGAYDLLLTIDNGAYQGTITIEDQFLNGKGLETIQFNDTTTINLTTLNWTQAGTSGRDTMHGVQYGGGTLDVVTGGDDGDTMYGYGGNDTLSGDNGNDFIYGGDGNDTLTGGAGFDLLDGGLGVDVLSDGSGDDKSSGGDGDDDYIYTSGNDYIYDSAGTMDEIFLPAGFTSGATKYFKYGDDLKIVFDANNSIYIKDHYVTGHAIETLKFDGGTNVNLVTVTTVVQGAPTDDSLSGDSFNNTLDGGAGSDSLYGSGGDDIYYGGVGDDYMSDYSNGNDTFDGGAGNDTMADAGGNDVYYYISGHDVISNESFTGTDVLKLQYGWTLADLSFVRYVAVNPNDLIIKISAGNDITITGQFLNAGYVETLEFLDLSTQDLHTMQVTTYGNEANNSVTGLVNASTNDIIYTYGGNDTVSAGDGNDIIYGGDDTDVLSGGNNDDILYGEIGNDTLNGNAGADTLDGGVGDDVMNGGDDNDLYIVDSISDVVSENLATGTDTVRASVSYTLVTGVENLILTGVSAINGTGNTVVNTITGNSANNTLDGGTGNDTLIGGLGNDTYVVDVLTDVVTENAAEGTDTIQTAITYTLASLANIENITLTGAAAVNATGNSAVNVLTGNSGVNTLDGSTGADTMVGGAGNDVYLVDNALDTIFEYSLEGVDTVQSSVSYTLSGEIEGLTLTGSSNLNATGNATANTLIGNSGVNTLIGLDGNDTLDGGAGNDTMIGGLGNDTYIIDSLSDVTTENASEGVDTIQAGSSYTLSANFENITLTGTGAFNATGNTLDNVLIGNSGVNTITGGTGNDTLDGGTGNDTLIGGTGNDTYFIDVATDVMTENAAEGTDTVSSAVTWTLAANFENLTLTGAAVINGTGTTLDNILIGNSAVNILTGLAGNDTLDGGAGNDTMIGGAGNDVYYVDSASDVTTELAAEGTDIIYSSITKTIAALTNIENLSLTGASAINATGNTGVNTLTGNSGNNTLDGGAGNDTMIGGAGDDTYVLDVITDTVIENAAEGIDTVSIGLTYTIGNNIENLTLSGTSAVNATGNTLDNVLTGNSGINILTGLAGNDTLNGGTGADTLIGGTGNDVYIVDNVGDVVTELSAEGVDLIQTNISIDISAVANVENVSITVAGALNATGNSLDNILTGWTGINILTGGAGNDTLDGGSAADTMIGGAGNDIYYVDNASDVVTEAVSEGNDTIYSTVAMTIAALTNIENIGLIGANAVNATGNTLDNLLTGNSNNNSLDGGAGTDTMVGGAGNDTYFVDNIADIVTEAAAEGTDAIQSSVTYTLGNNIENLTLTGAANINSFGNTLANTLVGNTGNNTLDGGAGIDSLAGGTGDDVYIVDSTSDIVTEAASAGTDTVQASASFTLGTNLENLILTGSADIDGTGNTAVNTLTGNSGNNTLNGGTGIDTMVGGAGNDTYFVDNAADVVTEGVAAGIDTILTSLTKDISALVNIENVTITATGALNATGNTLDNVLIGYTGVNILTGGAGNDTLDGGSAADTMIGGAGNDIYYVDNASDVVTENAAEGTDTIYSSLTKDITSLVNIEHLSLTGASNINATGNTLDNVLTGNSGVNILTGGAGNDTLNGGVGKDTMIGGAGNDVYYVDNAADVVTELAAEGTDTIYASLTTSIANLANIEHLVLIGASNINATGNTGVNILTGNTGNNTLNGGTGADTMIGGAGNDFYFVDNASDVVTELAAEGIDTVSSSLAYTLGSTLENLILTGSSAINGTGNTLDNVLTGNSGVNTLTGGAGNDTLDGGAGNDTMIGGTGNDSYYIDSGSDLVTELAAEGNDTIYAGFTSSISALANIENITLTGIASINATGNTSVNILTGNSGINTLDGGTGADTMAGGAGDDMYIVDNVSDVIIETSGIDTVQSSVSYTLGSNVERLILTGSSNINATGGADANILSGNSGVNILTGNDGNDTMNGGAGLDTLIGGLGDDVYIVDTATDTLTEGAGAGTDTIQSSVTFTVAALTNIENITLTGSTAINATGNGLVNILIGNSGNNTLTAGAGNDTLDGGAGTDTLVGGTNDDVYIVDSATDVITENASEGTDTIKSSVTYTIASLANIENLSLTGTSAINGTGNSTANILTGNSAANTLTGGAGADTLVGGAGADILYGGLDADVFKFDLSAMGTIDTIKDFTEAQLDRLDIKDILVGYLPGTSAITDFLEMTTVGANTVMKIDRDGSGTTYGWQQVATLEAITSLTDEAALLSAGKLIVS